MPPPLHHDLKAGLVPAFLLPGHTVSVREAMRTANPDLDAWLLVMKRLHDAGIPMMPGSDGMAGVAIQRELELWPKAGIPNANIFSSGVVLARAPTSPMPKRFSFPVTDIGIQASSSTACRAASIAQRSARSIGLSRRFGPSKNQARTRRLWRCAGMSTATVISGPRKCKVPALPLRRTNRCD